MKLFWFYKHNYASDFRIMVANDYEDLLAKIAIETGRDNEFVQESYEFEEISEIDGYRIKLEKI